MNAALSVLLTTTLTISGLIIIVLAGVDFKIAAAITVCIFLPTANVVAAKATGANVGGVALRLR